MKVTGAKVGQHIGFGGEFYTLWSVGTPDEDGVQDAFFYKNISKNLDEARKLYPDAEYSGLKGDSWVVSNSGEEFVPRDHSLPEFQCGKYSGELISECTDYNYLGWYYEEFPQAIEAKNVLLKNGYVEFNDYLITEERFVAMKARSEAISEIVGENIQVRVISNINSQWRIKILTEKLDALGTLPYGLEVEVSKDIYNATSERYYNGHNYRVLGGMRSMKGNAVVTIVEEEDFYGNTVQIITDFKKA